MTGISRNRRVHQVLFGGMGGHVAVATALMDATQWEHSVTFYGIDLPSEEAIAYCEQRSIPWHAVQKSPGLDLNALDQVYQSISASACDAVLLHSVTALPAALSWQLESNHSLIVVDHTAPAAKGRTEWVSVVLGLLAADRFVALTEDNQSAMRSALPWLARRIQNKVEVIANGVSVEKFLPASKPRELFTVSMLARFCEVRDQRGLVDAVRQVLGIRPDLRGTFRLVLAGDGETRQEVERHVARLEVGDVVQFPGVLDQAGVVELLQSSSVYVQWSFADSMSTSVMQAMACGLPVIATDIRGMRNLVTDGETGVLLSVGDSTELAKVLLRFLDDPSMQTAMGVAGRERIEQTYSSHTMGVRYTKLIDSIQSGQGQD